MRKFVIGDIHGRLDAFLNVLEQVSFDHDEDLLITLGDYCDGGVDTKGVVDQLLKIKNRVNILGNHDYWFLKWLHQDHPNDIWLRQGGKATLRSYGYSYFGVDPVLEKIPKDHYEFFCTLRTWYEDEDAIYVHGGFSTKKGIERTSTWDAIWDRDLITCEYARAKCGADPIWNGKLIIVGHTCSQVLRSYATDKKEDKDLPIILPNIVGLDTGAGHGAKLTIMELPSRKYWQTTIPISKISRRE